MKVGELFFGGLILILFSSLSATATAQMIATEDKARETVEIRNVTVKDGVISGVVINKSPHVIRDVELLIQYHWLWKNEFKPGEDSFGRAIYFTLDKELRPGESTTFTYRPEPPLPARPDGQFLPEVTLAGFTAVIPPGMASR